MFQRLFQQISNLFLVCFMFIPLALAALLASPAAVYAKDADPTQIATALNTFWNITRDAKSALTLFADNVVYEDVPLGVVNSGIAELEAFAQGYFDAAPPDSRFENLATVINGGHGTQEWLWTFTTTATFFGPTPGIPVAVRGVSVFQLDGNKIVRNSDYWDQATVLRQIGQEDFSHAFFMSLSEGLNMISLPLKSQTPFTARSFAKEIGATMVIKLDEKRQRFVGFTLDAPDDGFPIEGGKGYIVNLQQARQMAFTGAAWTNQPPVEAAPPLTVGLPDGAWAFVVSGRVDAKQAPMDRDASTGSLFYVTVRNTRTNTVATDVLREGYFAAAFADLSRQSVVEVGDRLEVTTRAAYWDGRNDAGEPVASGVYFYQFRAGDFSETRRMVILK
ncbi:nuclear transport factor 2 family protein [Candidatus Poribacteria bacterium]|nr:nuclear transport factor 2 family protein [Candidatus Poribacteria bacterium]